MYRRVSCKLVKSRSERLPSEQNLVTLKLEVARFSETSDQTRYTAWFVNPGDQHKKMAVMC